MSRYEELSDGSLMEVRRPIEGVPFFSDWLEALLIRRAAIRTTEVDRKEGSPTYGQHITKVVPLDRSQQQAAELMQDGTVKIICISCGGLMGAIATGFQSAPHAITQGAKALHRKSQSSQSSYAAQAGLCQIKIGALIQRAITEPCNEHVAGRHVRLLRRWMRQSVMKAGMGCPECIELYMAEVRRVEEDNQNRRLYAQCLREMYVEKGNHEAAKAVVQPKEYTAWLDVLSRSVKASQFTEAMARAIE